MKFGFISYKMVQRKVSNKLVIQPKNTLRRATSKPSLQNYDVKVVDLKAILMKKSRSINLSDLEFGGCSSTLITPTKTPSSKETSSYNSPNYMKSTNSSELHKVGKTSSLKKATTLTKAPSFKHSRTRGIHKKDVVCENLNAKRPTCSSTLKDYKFPPGCIIGEENLVMKVCPYTYCSLNGHRHTPAPPLKSFLASKRRILKTQKNVISEVISPGKRKRSEIKVPRYDSPQVSEIDFSDDVSLSEVNFSSEENQNEEKSPLSFLQNQGSLECDNNASGTEMDRVSSSSLDQLLGEVSDMEWEEGRSLAFHDEKTEISVQKDCGGDEIEHGFELEKFLDGIMLPYIYDEIMECLQFSDADTVSDSESNETGDGDYIVEQIVDDETNFTAKVEEGLIEGRYSTFSNRIEEIIKAQNEGLGSFQESSKGIYLLEDTKEEANANAVIEVTKSTNTKEVIPVIGDNSQAEIDPSEAGNTKDASLSIFIECQQLTDENHLFSVKDVISEEYDSNEVKLGSIKNYVQEVRKGIFDRGVDSINKLLDCCTKLKKSVRCKQTEEEREEDKDFNPRPPSFLPVEPEKNPEKVDLRHRDMDVRRNAQDWMLDHALQKAVTQLASPRKRKVALLVEAFEAVLPKPKYEPHMIRNTSGFSLARSLQAC